MENCIFCKIINNDIPCEKIYEDEYVLSFRDINPEAPVHILIIPKKHIANVNYLEETDLQLVGHIFSVAKKLSIQLGIGESGYRVVTNCGNDGGQTVDHLHFHLLGGRKLQWPPG